jgi:uncharacterized membrane protein (DUF485 family)
MAGLRHGRYGESSDQGTGLAARNSRIGSWLFLVYLSVYAAFVGLNAFSPDVMSIQIHGVNLAVVYGMVLIVMAFLLALVYCWLCRDQSQSAGSGEAASEEGTGR